MLTSFLDFKTRIKFGRYEIADKAISCFFSVLRQFKIVKPTRQPGDKNKQAFKNKFVFACCKVVKQQTFDLVHLSTKEILKTEYK
jgi:hypothetical protein